MLTITDSVVRYFVSNYLLRGLRPSLRVAVNMTLSWVNAKTVERVPTPLFGRLVRCSAHGPFLGDYSCTLSTKYGTEQFSTNRITQVVYQPKMVENSFEPLVAQVLL